LARALGIISARLLAGELLGVSGSGVGALITARTRRQPKTAGCVGLRVVAAATSGSSRWGADLEWRAVIS